MLFVVDRRPVNSGVIRLANIVMDSLNRLIDMGFVECGEWVVAEDQLVSKLLKCADNQNVLYAFVVDDAVMYIGKTVQSLRSRMQGYRTPGQTQLTNVRNNQNLRNALISGRRVAIYVLPDNGLLY